MIFPRTLKIDGSYRIMMIYISKMSTSNIMLDNVWMNTMQNGPKLLIVEKSR